MRENSIRLSANLDSLVIKNEIYRTFLPSGAYEHTSDVSQSLSISNSHEKSHKNISSLGGSQKPERAENCKINGFALVIGLKNKLLTSRICDCFKFAVVLDEVQDKPECLAAPNNHNVVLSDLVDFPIGDNKLLAVFVGNDIDCKRKLSRILQNSWNALGGEGSLFWIINRFPPLDFNEIARYKNIAFLRRGQYEQMLKNANFNFNNKIISLPKVSEKLYRKSLSSNKFLRTYFPETELIIVNKRQINPIKPTKLSWSPPQKLLSPWLKPSDCR